jgi:hypothetical protein
LLEEIRDIRNELSILSSVFNSQKEVLEALKDLGNGDSTRNGTRDENGFPPIATVQRELSRIARLDILAKPTYDEVT